MVEVLRGLQSSQVAGQNGGRKIGEKPVLRGKTIDIIIHNEDEKRLATNLKKQRAASMYNRKPPPFTCFSLHVKPKIKGETG
jgi:hypothetical protein